MKNQTKTLAIVCLISLITIIAFQNCGKTMSFTAIVPPSNEALVCNGFGTSTGENYYGIVGNIFVATPGQEYGSALQYPLTGTPVKTAGGELVTLYMSNINVPTRSFESGFVNQNGDALVDSNGQVLIEYFGLKMDFKFKLPSNFAPGYYQVGLDSDDGSVLKIRDSNGNMSTLVDDDGTHPTRSKCSSQAIYLDHNTKIPAELYYYQGPRVEIALRLFWKKVDSPSGLSQDCGTIGTADGTAASNYWKIVESHAFELPDSAIDYCSAH
jgi:hypothetical protein